MRMKRHAAVTVGVVALVLQSCALGGRLMGLSARESYDAMLARAGLDQAGLGRDWRQAGDRALASPLMVSVPFQEAGYFAPEEPTAVGYRLELQRGRRLAIDVTFATDTVAQLFVDLFVERAGDRPQRVASLAEGESQLLYVVEADGHYIVRVQPELLRGGRFTLTQRTQASLPFPVEGSDASRVQSLFGADRDAGARAHQGIDIFVPRGTPAVAVARGRARTGTNGLGGNVVWLRDASRGLNYYYAHLDRWAVEGERSVEVGDTIGYVGNTGNARSTAPHLHFGVYDDGAINPLPYVRPDDPVAAPPDEHRYLVTTVRSASARTPVRVGPGTGFPSIVALERHTPARVSGSSGAWLRVMLPDDTTGYVRDSAVGPLTSPLRRLRLTSAVVLQYRPDPSSPAIGLLDADTTVDVVGRFNSYELWRAEDGAMGWVRPPPPAR